MRLLRAGLLVGATAALLTVRVVVHRPIETNNVRTASADSAEAALPAAPPTGANPRNSALQLVHRSLGGCERLMPPPPTPPPEALDEA